MANLNVVTIAGNIGTEPEYRTFESGAMKTTFSLAVNSWNKKAEKEEVNWISVETFNKLGEYLKKGMKVCVSGSLVASVYAKDDGTKVKRVYVLAKTIETMQPKKEGGEQLQPQAQTQTQPQPEDLGCNADYPEDENTIPEADDNIPEIDESQIPF